MTDDVFPDRNMDHADKIAWVVEENGWCAEPVAPSDEPPRPGYTYTIGFERGFGHPEVVIFGLQPVAARGLLELMATQLDAGGTLPVGVFDGLLDNGLRCALLPVDRDEHPAMFGGADAFYGESGYRVMQFVWPDRDGHLPWEDGFDFRLLLAQPVIGN
ncbi:MAG: DUF4262 domain-containing protein [Microthrixaceae bacterium]